MKKILGILMAIFMTFTLSACGSNATQEEVATEDKQVQSTDSKNLVVYFSWSGNTKKIATKIQDEMKADSFRIVTKDSYPDDYDAVVDQAKKEQSDNIRPELSTHIDNLSQYDTIFIGYPNWWGDMPMALYSFFDEYDFSGKTIIPFCTHGGSGLSDTVNTIKEQEPNATVLEGLAIKDNSIDNSDSNVTDWLDKLNINK